MKIEQKMKNENRKFFWNLVTIGLFAVTMIIGLIIGLLVMLRPEKSELEKRELTKFPEFSFSSFIDGSYTSGIETWYADTYPFREKLLTTEQSIKTYYGIQTDSINSVSNGDEIPNIEDLLASVTEESQATAAETTAASEESQMVVSVETGETGTAAPETAPTETTAVETTAVQTAAPAETVDGQQLALMNPQEAGSVNVLNLVGYCVYGFNLSAADQYCLDVATVANALNGVCNVYDILIPDNSAIMLDADTKAAWKLPDESTVIKYYQGKLGTLTSNVKNVDIYDTLMSHNSEYLYFYTDHHWTQLGAYYAYTEFCKAAGMEANPLSAYEQIIAPNFLGSYYSSNGYSQLQDNPDTVISYVPLTTNTFRFYDTWQGTYREGRIVRDTNSFEPHQRYLGFIYGDNPISYIENPNVKNGRSCIIVKESFGNPFAPFLADHYEKVIIVDYRDYKDSVVQLAKDEGINDIIFINNLEAISDKPTMDVLGNICK